MQEAITPLYIERYTDLIGSKDVVHSRDVWQQIQTQYHAITGDQFYRFSHISYILGDVTATTADLRAQIENVRRKAIRRGRATSASNNNEPHVTAFLNMLNAHQQTVDLIVCGNSDTSNYYRATLKERTR